VLITLDNQAGLLKPGMNGEAAVLVDQRDNVLAVPNDAIRTAREAPMLAGALGLDGDSVQAQVQAQMAEMGNGFQGRRGPQDRGLQNIQSPRGGMRVMPGEVALDSQQRQTRAVSEQECTAFRAALAKKPDVAKQLQDMRQKMMSGEIDFAAMREQSQKLYAALGVDPAIARGCQAGAGRGSEAAGGPQVAGGASKAGGTAAPGGAANAQARGSARGSAAATQGVPTPVQSGEFPARRVTRTGVVFVAANGTYTPKVVRLGIGNFDYTEVISGLNEGDQVALLATAAIQAARDSSNARFRQMTGGGMPGMQKTQDKGGNTSSARPR
jgi:HlyD family secretion protein